jgi:hypothetical protein
VISKGHVLPRPQSVNKSSKNNASPKSSFLHHLQTKWLKYRDALIAGLIHNDGAGALGSDLWGIDTHTL